MAEPKRTPGNGEPGDGQQQAALVVDEAENLRALLAAAEQERDQFRDLAQRTRAEFENYQKRSAREREQERKYVFAPLARDLLPALDNLERALEAAKRAGDSGPLVQGVALVQAQMLDALRRHGITRLEAEGKPFDPHREEAVMQRPTKDAPPGTVVEVLEPGYMIHDRVLRAAKVVVSAPEA
jgi:molecular chaperone GrpE